MKEVRSSEAVASKIACDLDAGAEEEPADADTPTTTPNPASVYKEEDLPTFIEWPEYSYWAGFIRLDNSTYS